ncbi:MAG: hypothetical protein J5I93_17405 [Pirellulaceae bacterium]|nr:hypothetical protein [Pirellulaceae bacterium]
MDNFDRNDLTRLLNVPSRPCVTIYMPTHTVGLQGQQDPIRLKNLLTEAEQQLGGHWMRPAEAREMLEPVRALLTDSMFWNEADQGLAVFLAPDMCVYYRLPCAFEERLAVGDQFRIRPLLPALNHEGEYYVLALSQNKVVFYAGDAQQLRAVDVPELPAGMQTALNYDGADRGMQVHSGSWGATGKQGAVFHGQGGVSDSVKDDLRSFFRLVSSAVSKRLGTGRQPLILACVDYLAPLYREVNSYPALLPQIVEGNPDYLDANQLFQRVRPLAAQHFDRQRQQSLETFRQRNGGKTASSRVEEIVAAAQQGRVDTLLVDQTADVWGQFQAAEGTVTVHAAAEPDDVELLDVSVLETLRHRGTVYPVPADQSPAQGPVAALFRY